ncbi:hypothetical protein GPECTOR_29g64 [Gonium pectorale]|uniref:Kinesin motor domain-containing protein n=1 Tax=Gonium pectorale TaxID=33097 RepID=A0A150GEP3_GONPE|nr:hypothetical protein GPECTOR_29g64 [Gonium pectorale]|eukprot:KXZ48288.1 hypothetical protein GPECTOR_29g64 [Gonium pectorale]
MIGPTEPASQTGLAPNTLRYLCARMSHLEQRSAGAAAITYGCSCSFLELYRDELRDLLCESGAHEKQPLRIWGDKATFVKGLSEHPAASAQQMVDLLLTGLKRRNTAPTGLNAESSRSHAVFTVTVSKRVAAAGPDGEVTVAKLNLVDLAGSERASLSVPDVGYSHAEAMTPRRGQAPASAFKMPPPPPPATAMKSCVRGAVLAGQQADRRREACDINASLMWLGRVIGDLNDSQRTGKAVHIPYRSSNLTRLLQESLGGNAKTTIIACISPSAASYDETLSTLRFARDARRVRNAARVAEPVPADPVALQRAVESLRAELEALRAGVAGPEQLLELASANRQLAAELERAKLDNRRLQVEAHERDAACNARVAEARAALLAAQQETSSLEGRCAGLIAAVASAQSAALAAYQDAAAERERGALCAAEAAAARSELLAAQQTSFLLERRGGELDAAVAAAQAAAQAARQEAATEVERGAALAAEAAEAAEQRELQLAEARAALAAAQRQAADLLRRCEDLASEAGCLQEAELAAQQAAEAERRKGSALEAEAAELRAALSAEQRAVAQLQANCRQQTEANAQLESAAKVARQAALSSEEESSALAASLEQARAELASVHQTAARPQQRCAQLAEALAEAQALADAARRDAAAEGERAAALGHEVRELRAALTSQRDGAEQRCTALARGVAEARTDAGAWQERCRELSTRAEAAEAAALAAQQQEQQRDARAAAEAEQAHRQLGDLRQQLAAARYEAAEATAQAAARATAEAAALQEAAEAKRQLEAARQQLLAAQRELARARDGAPATAEDEGDHGPGTPQHGTTEPTVSLDLVAVADQSQLGDSHGDAWQDLHDDDGPTSTADTVDTARTTDQQAASTGNTHAATLAVAPGRRGQAALDLAGLQSEVRHAAEHNYADRLRQALTKLQDGGQMRLIAAKHTKGETPLHTACGRGHKGVALELLSAGAQVDARTTQVGQTPLHRASHGGHTELVQALLARAGGRLDINAQDANGNTALHLAGMSGHQGVACSLLGAGADTTLVNQV